MNKPVHKQSGVASIEMAITLPLLLLLIISTAELGRAFYQYNTLTKSTESAVRHLANIATEGTTKVINLTDNKIQQVKNMVVYANIAGSGAPLLEGLGVDDVTVAAIDPAHIQVNARYTYSPIYISIPTFGLTSSNISTNFTLNSTTTMRAL